MSIGAKTIRKAEVQLSSGEWVDVTEYVDSLTLDGVIVPQGEIIDFVSEDGSIFLRLELSAEIGG